MNREGFRGRYRLVVARAWRHHNHTPRTSAARHHGYTVSKHPKVMLIVGASMSHALT